MRDRIQRNRDIVSQSSRFFSFVSLRHCVTPTLIILLSLMFVSCSPYKRIAYDFVKHSKGTSMAFYVADELKKMNIRRDCDPSNVDLVTLDEDQLRDTIEARTEIVNKIDDDIFLDVMYSSFSSTIKDYGVVLDYDKANPDSVHRIVNLSYIEIQEYLETLLSHCGVDGNYEFIPSTAVNVAAWFEMSDGDTTQYVFTEQNYGGYIEDCYYSLDSLKNLVTNVEMQQVSIEGLYDFAVVLGKLYAGYCYDFFMNEYVKKTMLERDDEYDDEIYMRYDPYESYIHYTWRDKFVKIVD